MTRVAAQTGQGVDERALAERVGEWVSGVTFEDLPPDVVTTTKLRILDVLGLALAGLGTPFGQSTRAATRAMSPEGPAASGALATAWR